MRGLDKVQKEPILLDNVCVRRAQKCQVHLNHALGKQFFMRNNNIAPRIVPIRSPWNNMLLEAVKQIQCKLFFVSPYIKNEVIPVVKETLRSRNHLSAPLHVQVITRTLSEEFLNGSSDIDALQQLMEWPIDIPGSTVELRSINNIHAKVWIFDTSLAFVGSGNATPSGLAGNLEYGLAVSDTQIVTQIRYDWQQWWEQAAEVTENQLEKMQSWLNEIKSNEELIQIEAETEKKRKLVERKVGVAPCIGKLLPIISSNKTTTLPLTPQTTKVKNKKSMHMQQSFSVKPQSLWNHYSKVDKTVKQGGESSLDDTSGISSTTSNTSANKRLVIVSDPPWDKVLDLSNSPETVSQALWYHSSEVQSSNGSVVSIGGGSILTVGAAHEDVTKLPVVPSEATSMPGEHLWRALLATFPIVDVVRTNEGQEHAPSLRVFLQIDSIQQKGKRLLQCTWSDENRTSQAAFVRKKGDSQSLWTITLNIQDAVKLIKRLNAALRDQWWTSTSIVHLSVQSSPDQLLLFYSLNPFIVKTTGLDFKQAEIGLIAISCQRVDMANSPLPLHPHICLIAIRHQNLADALLQLKNFRDATSLSISQVEIRIDPPEGQGQCLVTIGLLGTSSTYNVSVNQCTPIEEPIILRFDYAALAHIIFFSSYGVNSWQISIGMNAEKVQFIPVMMLKEDSLFKQQHELRNLMR